MLAERCPAGSTGGSALDYAPAMFRNTAIVPALLVLLVSSPGCKEDEPPANEPGEFGEPCVPGANDDTPDGCVGGNECYLGYCEETCIGDDDCQPVEGWDHTCVAGVCQLWCDDKGECPQTLGTPMVCGVMGSAMWCRAESESS